MDSRRATIRNMRSKCRCSYVLQFTFRHAVCCVLHRPPSQVIHCTVLFFEKFQPKSWPEFSTNSFAFHSSSRGEQKEGNSRGRRSTLSGFCSEHSDPPHRNLSSRDPERQEPRDSSAQVAFSFQQTGQKPWAKN